MILLTLSNRYQGFLKFLRDGQLDDILGRVRSLQLDQGFQDPSDLCELDILSPREHID